MQFAAYLHGTPGRLPFIGHFRSMRQHEGLRVAVAGSISSREDVSTAFRAARLIETTINGVNLNGFIDRHVALNAVWSSICNINDQALGPNLGADLCALFAVSDAEGTGIAGVGWGGVWSWQANALEPLAVGEHPLLGEPGRPDRLAGILTLDNAPQRFVAISKDNVSSPPVLDGLAQRCGIHS